MIPQALAAPVFRATSFAIASSSRTPRPLPARTTASRAGGSSRISPSRSWSRPIRRRRHTSSWPTRSTPAGRRPITADPSRSGRPMSPSGPSICRTDAHGRLHLPPGGIRPRPDALGGRVRAGALSSLLPRQSIALTPDHAPLGWPAWWRSLWFMALAAIIFASSVSLGPGAKVALQDRWKHSVHTFTWGSGKEAMKPNRR